MADETTKQSAQWQSPAATDAPQERAWSTGEASASAPPATPRSATGESVWKPGIIALRPQNFGEVLNAAFKSIRFNPAVTVGIPALVLIVSQVFVSAGMWNIYGDPSLYDPYATDPSFIQEDQLGSTLVGISVAFVVYGLASIIASAFVAIATARAVLGERISAGEAWQAVRGRILPLVLYSAMLGGAWTVAIVLAIALGVAASLSTPTIVLYVIVMIVAAAVGGAYLAVKLALPTTAIVIEKVSAVRGLARGWRLTSGRFWPIFGIIIVAGTIVNVISQVFGFPLGIVGALGAIAWPGAAALIMNLVYGLSMYLGALMSIVFVSAIYAIIYIDQRMRLEGFDLQLIEAAQQRS